MKRLRSCIIITGPSDGTKFRKPTSRSASPRPHLGRSHRSAASVATCTNVARRPAYGRHSRRSLPPLPRRCSFGRNTKTEDPADPPIPANPPSATASFPKTEHRRILLYRRANRSPCRVRVPTEMNPSLRMGYLSKFLQQQKQKQKRNHPKRKRINYIWVKLVPFFSLQREATGRLMDWARDQIPHQPLIHIAPQMTKLLISTKASKLSIAPSLSDCYVGWSPMAGVVRLWNGLGVQILVLVSFMLQVFLLMFARMRRRNISIVPRTLLWLAYLLADYIAVYILGHMSFCGKSHGHQQLMAFWAPFLLVHLGGQDNITAYSIEDSQLWPRHLLSFVAQTVGVAYVLYKYVAGSWTLVTAAVLIFVSGVLKYGERVWALKSSSLDNVSKFIDSRKLSEAKREPRAQWGQGEKLDHEEVLQGAHDLLPICMAQLVDYKFWPSTFQSKAIELFDNKHQMFELVEMQLSLMYDFLYTKASVVFTWYGCFIRAISSVATITAFFLFQSSIGKNDLSRVDAIVTYILIAGAVLLEMTSLLKAMGSTWTCALLRARRWHRLHSIVVCVRRRVKAAERNRRWSGSIGQPELSNSSHGSGGCVSVQCLGCKDLWKKLHHSLPVISNGTKKVVLEEVCRMVGACKGNEDIMRSYSGQCALNPWHRFFEDPTSRAGIDFDDKILSWYFATKMFLSGSSRVEEQDYVVEAITAVSNYMIFLLVERPYMLPSPVRPGLYANNEATYVGLDFSDVKRISRRGKLDNRRRMWDLDTRRDGDELDRVREKLDILREELDIPREELARRSEEELDKIRLEQDKIRLEVDGSNENLEELNRIMEKLEELDRRSVELRLGPSPPPALARVAEIAVGLLEAEARGELEVRRVVLGVWVEMLCYAAHHCSRDSHARQLNSGGEFITIVWLLSTAMFNRRYCDEPWFKKGVDEFFRSPFHFEALFGSASSNFWVQKL